MMPPMATIASDGSHLPDETRAGDRERNPSTLEGLIMPLTPRAKLKCTPTASAMILAAKSCFAARVFEVESDGSPP